MSIARYIAVLKPPDKLLLIEHERGEYVLATEYDALAARVAQLEQLIHDHNNGCSQSCFAMAEHGRCEGFTGRGRKCPDCPEDWTIELPAADGEKP